VSLALAPPTRDVYPLSLHDALPILLEALPSPGEPEGGPPAWARWAVRTAWPVLLGDDEPQSGGTLGRLQAARRVLAALAGFDPRSEEHTSELQSRENLVCRLLLEKK